MGLYDRDYMRGDTGGDDDDSSGLVPLVRKRNRLIVAGVLVLLAGLIMALIFY